MASVGDRDLSYADESRPFASRPRKDSFPTMRAAGNWKSFDRSELRLAPLRCLGCTRSSEIAVPGRDVPCPAEVEPVVGTASDLDGYLSCGEAMARTRRAIWTTHLAGTGPGAILESGSTTARCTTETVYDPGTHTAGVCRCRPYDPSTSRTATRWRRLPIHSNARTKPGNCASACAHYGIKLNQCGVPARKIFLNKDLHIRPV